MNYLIDTCVLSEYVKKTPDNLVIEWLNQQRFETLFLSAITIAEIRKGICRIKLSQPKRQKALTLWLNTIEIKFSGQILPITNEVLNNWAEISANAELEGQKMAVMDSLITATAYSHKLILVTRNVDDFKMAPIEIVNPFQ
ncbi:MAG: type II toxin-antitoxin system VapC family toxin [Methylococcales bacterium]|nr:type II toxin-antitoxin system VapC family toxin [Methylococcales bacterium]